MIVICFCTVRLRARRYTFSDPRDTTNVRAIARATLWRRTRSRSEPNLDLKIRLTSLRKTTGSRGTSHDGPCGLGVLLEWASAATK